MDHFRLRKYRGPEVWTRVRIAYEAGESGPSVARRFDVGLANLRKKAREGGWCRRAQARRADRELAPDSTAAPDQTLAVPDPAQALAAALARASAALAAGRAEEATALIRAAEALARLSGARPAAAPQPDAAPPRDEAALEAELRRAHDETLKMIERRAARLAREMLADESHAGAMHGAYVFRWRARVLGPECAAADRARGEAGGWAGRYWREDGGLKSPREARDSYWKIAYPALRLAAERQED